MTIIDSAHFTQRAERKEKIYFFYSHRRKNFIFSIMLYKDFMQIKCYWRNCYVNSCVVYFVYYDAGDVIKLLLNGLVLWSLYLFMGEFDDVNALTLIAYCRNWSKHLFSKIMPIGNTYFYFAVIYIASAAQVNTHFICYISSFSRKKN